MTATIAIIAASVWAASAVIVLLALAADGALRDAWRDNRPLILFAIAFPAVNTVVAALMSYSRFEDWRRS